jgi:KAP family P-loop domain
MPRKILLDNPSVDPVLGFKEYASGLKDLIERSDPQFSVGVFGGWGSGKTTLMLAIKDQLDDQIVSVWFNAWRYEKEEHLIIPLLDVLRDALVAWAADTEIEIDPSVKKRAIKAASTITKAARAIFAGITVKVKLPVVELGLDANQAVTAWRESSSADDARDAQSPQSPYHASFKALHESLGEFTQRGKQRIVVFIDDLDRCLPSNALQVLESMKLFFDLEGFVFVVGLDQSVIEACINWNYRYSNNSGDAISGPPISGQDYIKKLFQVPFNLPAISRDQVDNYLTAIFLDGKEKDANRDNLMEVVRPHLDVLIGDSEVNPREIKRYINAYILQKLIQPDLDDDATLVLLAFSFRPDWRAAYQAFRSKHDAFIEAVKRQLGGEESALNDLNPNLANLPQSFFQYIKSDSGRKLLSLDAPQLDEQVRALRVTQPSEEAGAYSPLSRGVKTELYTIGGDLRRSADKLDGLRPYDLTGARETLEGIRKSIEKFNYTLQQVSEDQPFRQIPEIDDAKIQLQQLKNDTDVLTFLLGRSDDIQLEDYEKFLERRTKFLGSVQRLLVMFNSLF